MEVKTPKQFTFKTQSFGHGSSSDLTCQSKLYV